MIFDTYDYEFLRLTGLCRYLPSGLRQKYDAPVFSGRVISNLRLHGLIKTQSDMSSFKLTARGRALLAEMGYTFPDDGRTNVKKPSYRRKLRSAQWNVLLHLAGTDIFFDNTRTLAEIPCGYVSSLMLRSDSNMKVLAGTKFLGILKISDTAYIPYHIESAEDWIIPGYEREIFSSQLSALPRLKEVKVIVTGESLEGLWSYIYPGHVSKKFSHGMKPFGEALEELGSDCLIVPCSREGVIQMSVLSIEGSRERIARALGCDTNTPAAFSQSDGMKDNIPYIIAVDFDIRRIVKALKQSDRENPDIIPCVCCLRSQKNTMFRLLKRYKCQKTMVITVNRESLRGIFPELCEKQTERREYRTKEGKCIEVVERKLANIRD